MHKILVPDIYIKDTKTAKGRGVFASRNFLTGEVVDECPVILLHGAFDSFPNALKKVVFNWQFWMKTEIDVGVFAIPLGYGVFYNHNNPANMRYEADTANLMVRFLAVRNVRAGEELFINYNAIGGGAYWHEDHWFEKAKIKPLISD